MKKLDQWIDRLTETAARNYANKSSRRSFVRGIGVLIVGASATPVLPVFRHNAFAQDSSALPEQGDPYNCNYWRYCAMDGYLCSCCGGSYNTCPPGTVASDITWVGTCRNPVDGKHYVISYNDCCGKAACGQCACQRDEGDTPNYRPQNSNNINWCTGSEAGTPYVCSLSVVVGVKE